MAASSVQRARLLLSPRYWSIRACLCNPGDRSRRQSPMCSCALRSRCCSTFCLSCSYRKDGRISSGRPWNSPRKADALLCVGCRFAEAEALLWGLMRASNTGMIRKLKSGEYRIYSRSPDKKTGKRRNLGTFRTRVAAERHERAIQYFKHG